MDSPKEISMFDPPKVIRPIVIIKKPKLKRPSLLAKEKLELASGFQKLVKD
jgi:hypothetical protein